MRLARKASLPSSNALRRLICTSSIRLKASKLPKKIKTKSMLDALIVPRVPNVKPGSLSEKLQKRLDGVVNASSFSQRTAAANMVDGMIGIVTGWGDDKLAPPPSMASDHERPSHDPRVDLRTVRQFELEAYYRHGRDTPHFERRLHLWISDNSDEPTLRPIETPSPQPPVTQLSHSLDRILFNTGPHWLKDPRTQVYNFDQWLENIPDIHEFDFGRLAPYMTSSRDDTLFNLARREGKKFAGSTSSLTSLLSHIYFVISGGRGVDTSVLSSAFADEPREFSYGARWPGGVTLRHKDGLYCIDSHEIEDPEKHLLLNMGTMLEKFLTHSPSDFNLLRRDTPITEELAKMQRGEAYQYSKSQKFVMRAQLDAQDPRLPGGGVFDIKTRAAVAIRYDPLNYKNNSGYLIKTTQGAFESFEREQYDLFRAAFLKYVFQVRIGNMDGIFVAYHNTAYMFGFQYFSREDMDDRLFGGTVQGDRVFQKCVKCMEEILSEVILCFPGVSVNVIFETSPQDNALRLYVEPAEWDEAGERPVLELLVTATNYLNSERVVGPMNFGLHDDDWSILLNITKSSKKSEALNSSIKKQMEALVERKNEFMFWMPQGVSPSEMAVKWLKIDYTSGMKLDGFSNEESNSAGLSIAHDVEELAQLALKFQGRRRPSEFVESLRKLAKEGRTYLEGLKASSREEASLRQDEDLVTTSIEGSVASDEGVNIGPVFVDGFSRNIRTISSLDNLPSSSVYGRSGSEEGPIERMKIDVPVEGTSVHVKSVEEVQLTGERGRDAASTEDTLGVNPDTNDNQVPPNVEGADGEIDHSETPDILGSEEDQLEMLDPINEDDTHTSDQPSESTEVTVELDVEDQAWSSNSSPTKNEAEPTREQTTEDPKAPAS